jgi:hypothetical protein
MQHPRCMHITLMHGGRGYGRIICTYWGLRILLCNAGQQLTIKSLIVKILKNAPDLVLGVEESLGIAYQFITFLGLGAGNWKGLIFPLFIKESDWSMELGYTILSFCGICRVDIEMKCAALSEGLNLEAIFRCMVPNLGKSISHSPWMIIWSSIRICRRSLSQESFAHMHCLLSCGLNHEAEFRCMVPNLGKSIFHSPWMIIWSSIRICRRSLSQESFAYMHCLLSCDASFVGG